MPPLHVLFVGSQLATPLFILNTSSRNSISVTLTALEKQIDEWYLFATDARSNGGNLGLTVNGIGMYNGGYITYVQSGYSVTGIDIASMGMGNESGVFKISYPIKNGDTILIYPQGGGYTMIYGYLE